VPLAADDHVLPLEILKDITAGEQAKGYVKDHPILAPPKARPIDAEAP
jgi:hypothetical protein